MVPTYRTECKRCGVVPIRGVEWCQHTGRSVRGVGWCQQTERSVRGVDPTNRTECKRCGPNKRDGV